VAVSIFELACRGGRHAQSNRGIVTLKPIRCNSLGAIRWVFPNFAGMEDQESPGKVKLHKLDVARAKKYQQKLMKMKGSQSVNRNLGVFRRLDKPRQPFGEL
jgi:hypothetical protein